MKHRERSLRRKRAAPDNYRDRMFRYWYIDREVICQERKFHVRFDVKVRNP